MTFKNIAPEQVSVQAQALHAKINEFYDRAADVLQGINRYVPVNQKDANKIPIPFSLFYLYHRELNNLKAELSESFNDIVNTIELAIQNAGQSFGDKLSPEVQVEIEQVLTALEALKALDNYPDPIDSILETDALNLKALQWQAPPIVDLMSVLDAILLTAEKSIASAEESLLDKKNLINFVQTCQSVLAPMRQAGLIARDFTLDLAPLIRLQVKSTYQAVEQQIKAKGLNVNQYWAEDMMNALTVHIINIRDGRILNDNAQTSFSALLKVVMSIASLALKPLIWRQHEWLEELGQLQSDILALEVSEEVKKDLSLALKRIENGACSDKATIQAHVQQLYQKIQELGWFSPSFAEIWSDARKRLLQVQGHLFQAIKKRRDDLENALNQTTRIHEDAFNQYLYTDISDGSVKHWLQMKQNELLSIFKNQKPDLLSLQSIEDWEQKYRQFWIGFFQDLDNRCFNSSWQQRYLFEQARRNAATAREMLSDPKCGHMLFTFGEVNKGALLNLLAHEWNKVYGFTLIAKDPAREQVYQTLRGQLIGARSSIEAMHYLNSAMLDMQMSHAKESLAHHICGRSSRGATVLGEVVSKAQNLAILPKNERLVFSNVINCIQSTMRSYFNQLFFRKPEHQADVARILNTAIREREKMMMLGEKYSQDKAENVIMKQVKGLCESLEATHANRPIVRLAHFFGGNWQDDYLEHWKRVYRMLKDDHQLNAFHVEAGPAILLRLEIVIRAIKGLSGIKTICPGFSDERERVIILLKSLKRVIQEKGYDSISVANEFNRVLIGLEDRNQFFFSDFGEKFKACYDDLKSRELLVYVEPHTLLEEEMGKSMDEIRQEAQRLKRGAAIAKTKAQALLKK
ncbi:MAG: hypothetical protein WC748_08535 [Legionellales bacterium]|jgi:hypothetical protein